MKVALFNGSPKEEGNTFHALKIVTEVLNANRIETEIIHVGNKVIRGCIACNGCVKNKDEKCVLPGDEVNEWIQKMKEADGIIIGSPVYFAGIAGTMKAFLDRSFYVTSANNSMLRHKVGASVAAVRRSGGVTTFDQLNNYISYAEMLMPTSNYWNVIHGTKPGEALKDEEGVQIMKVLGKNMAWLLKNMQDNKLDTKIPEIERKVFTNFIR